MKSIWNSTMCPRSGRMSPGYDRRARARVQGPWRSTTMSELRRWSIAIGLSALLWPGSGQAQMHHQHPASADTTAHHRPKPVVHHHGATAPRSSHGGMDMPGMDMGGMDMGEMPMSGMYGPYSMT